VAGFGECLNQFSANLAQRARRAVDEALATVLRRVLLSPPDADVLGRIGAALRHDLAERCCGSRTAMRALRITGTAAVAIATTRDPGAPAGAGVLPPLSIGLTANCVPMTAATLDDDGAARESAWIARAIATLATELDRELAWQFTLLGQAVADLILDGLDHDLLLI
jgi:hypothetical protein